MHEPSGTATRKTRIRALEHVAYTSIHLSGLEYLRRCAGNVMHLTIPNREVLSRARGRRHVVRLVIPLRASGRGEKCPSVTPPRTTQFPCHN